MKGMKHLGETAKGKINTQHKHLEMKSEVFQYRMGEIQQEIQ